MIFFTGFVSFFVGLFAAGMFNSHSYDKGHEDGFQNGHFRGFKKGYQDAFNQMKGMKK